MRKIIYFFFFLVVLIACNRERKPLEILPMTANNPSIRDIGKPPVPGFFYVKNFSDDKECLKQLLTYIKDTIRRELPFKTYCSYSVQVHKKNKGIEFEGGEAYSEQNAFSFWFNKEDTHLFHLFQTWSDLWMSTEDFPTKCDYKYYIIRKDKAAVVYFDYKEFNTDVWQKFMNVVFYDRSRMKQSDFKKYDLSIPPQVTAWRNWSAPTRYSLLNQRTKEIECIIKYPLADNYNAFTMEIH